MGKALIELAGLFLNMGTIGFGGPAVYVAIMDREVVQRRAWLSREQFLDLLGMSNLIPGPISTQMAAHVGYHRAGLLGLVVAGASFILPAVLITTALAWAYVEYGPVLQAGSALRVLRGINAAVLAVIFTALAKLARTAISSRQLAVISIGVTAAALARFDAVLSLLTAALIGTIFLHFSSRKNRPSDRTTLGAIAGVAVAGSIGLVPCAAAPAGAAAIVPLWKIFLFFLKVGTLLFGGGYVLIAYLEHGLVFDYQWLSAVQPLDERQLLDAIAVGQFTPGPILSTATFVGYLLGGFPGAALATLGVFLPSFFFVAVISRWIPSLRRSQWASLAMDAVNAASIGLMAGVTVLLARSTLTDWRSWLLAVAAAAVALRWQVAAFWLVLVGGAAGWLLY